MILCYYATSHGYGHAIRISQVIKELPADIDVIIRTAAPEALFREEIKRPFRYIPAEFDCGCLQSDSVTVLKRETLTRYREIDTANRGRLAAEIEFLKREAVTCVACDIPSFPLHAAAEVGIPGIAISNFTWHDIYSEYAETADDHDLLKLMASDYACATEALIPPMSVPTIERLFTKSRSLPMICRRRVNIRERLVDHLEHTDSNRPHIALMYIGLWGLDIDWNRIEALSDWTFITFEDLPTRASNVVTLAKDAWPFADVAASVDVVVSKPGYGTISECVANNVPFVYIPRKDFAEYAALHDGLNRWGGGVVISTDDFATGNWGASLTQALASTPDPNVYAVDGAEVAARILMEYGTR